MSSHGYPDYQRYAQWFGTPLIDATAFAIGAGSHTDGPFNVNNWSSVVLYIKPTGGQVTATIRQTASGVPASLLSDTVIVVPAGATRVQSVVLLGNSVSLILQGAAVGETVDYALVPSNTAVNTGTVSNATVNVDHNGALVGGEPGLDFVDAGQNKFTVTDDGAAQLVHITPPKIIAGSVSGAGAIIAGTGFAVARTAVGRYTITFAPAFAAPPVVVGSPLINGGAEWFGLQAQPVAGSATTYITQYAGGAINFFDDAFHFFAFAVT